MAHPPAAGRRAGADFRERLEPHQTIDGWAVYPRCWEAHKTKDRFDGLFERVVEPVTSLVVNELGINAVRLEAWNGGGEKRTNMDVFRLQNPGTPYPHEIHDRS